MKTICVTVVWMGPFPGDFGLWLNSVEKNPSIDFYIITDREAPENSPSNVYYIKSTLEEVKAKFEKKLGMKVRINKPYKLCDFKPVWWMLMDERLNNYDYYGYCDIDMVFGDIRHFLTDEFLEKYDKIFDRGYFTLYKNSEEMRYFFKKTADKDNVAYPYTKAFKTNYACYFDEFMGMGILSWQYKNGYVDQLDEKMIQDPDWKKLEFSSYITHKSFIFHWDNGKLYRINVDAAGKIIDDLLESNKGDEILLAHIQKRKFDIDFDANNDEQSKDYWIIPNKYTIHKPEGELYSEADKAEFTEKVRISDKDKQIKNLRENGIIQYIPHFLRTRKIRKFTRIEKGYF
ncbi:MAG: hypothetical protein J5717_01510 [Lachnospiraceae bacterium]|nr:hypothetical protein [Lachnospiraceae bacterium]